MFLILLFQILLSVKFNQILLAVICIKQMQWPKPKAGLWDDLT